jgi:Fe2+ or Zn2+ uptake regulation protein
MKKPEARRPVFRWSPFIAPLISFPESRARSYLLHRLPVHHHHLICSGCGTVLDFTGCGLDALEKKLSRSTGFNIDNHRLEFSGKCRECQKKL